MSGTPSARRVTVLVPTANRPELLEFTLRSIARQTARDQILSVIVSENLGDRRSKTVCEAFPELPIRYTLRDPQLSPMQHVRTLMEEAEGEYSALVCDDDLWSPGHLASAVESLDRHPDASAHFSAIVQSGSELGPEAAMPGASLLWLAAGRPPRFSEYVYRRDAILALCWIDTPFSWSTLVGRTPAVAAAARALTDAPHPFYADRMLYPALAALGKIIHDPGVDTIYRLYPGNWQSTQAPEFLGELIHDAWLQIDQLAEDEQVDLANLWRGYLTDLPETLLDDVAIVMQRRFSNDELVHFGLDSSIPLVPLPSEPPPPPPPPPVPPAWKRYGGRVKRAWLDLRGVEHWVEEAPRDPQAGCEDPPGLPFPEAQEADPAESD